MNRPFYAILLVISGLIAYWFLRPEIYILEVLGWENSTPLTTDSPFFLWLKNHYADAVWCLAAYLMADELDSLQYPKVYSMLLWRLPLVSEGLQAIGLLPGTFDWVDVLIYVSLLILYSIKTISMKKLKLHAVGLAVCALAIFGLVASKTSKPVVRTQPVPKKPVVYTNATFLLQPKPDEIFTKPSLSNILKTTGNTSIVLRVPVSEEDKITEAQKQINNTIYSTIEKELLKADYVVRDRAMFAKALEGENSSADYAGIHKSTKTDLILELVSYGDIKHNTNKYVDADGNEKAASVNFSFTGTSAEFKLISVKDNDLVGSYTFYYTPCVAGCQYRINAAGTSNTLHAVSTNTKDTPYEYVAPDVLENFFKECSIRLIKELKAK
ncbi:hypothetical protein WIW50_12475 [Flavobacteriaceae bacterium 3-367]